MTTPVPAVYVTGTDTGIGKTFVSCALLLAARHLDRRAWGMKPVASGAEPGPDGHLRNDDVEQLRHWSATPRPDAALVNPFLFRAPIAPQLAAEDEGRTITLPPLRAAFDALSFGAQALIVEGVGGWSVPMSDHLMQADIVRALKLPVVIVVGIRLGCINHAVLTERAIRADGVEVLGYIANRVDPNCLVPDRVITSLDEELDCPRLADLPHGVSVERAAFLLLPAIPKLLG